MSQPAADIRNALECKEGMVVVVGIPVWLALVIWL
jgi:hypothetical protein